MTDSRAFGGDPNDMLVVDMLVGIYEEVLGIVVERTSIRAKNENLIFSWEKIRDGIEGITK
jgi:hypothetical protein